VGPLHYYGFMGLTIDKILVILVIAMFVLGPERLPMYAKKLGELVRSVKRMADGAKDRLRDEMGPEFDEVDWKQLDPRQYDPRRIIRDALLEDQKEAQTEARRSRAAQASQTRRIGGGPVAAQADAAVGAEAVAGAGAVGVAAAASALPQGNLGALNFDEEAT
jgi:sec-independent protein translocase protein TatB